MILTCGLLVRGESGCFYEFLDSKPVVPPIAGLLLPHCLQVDYKLNREAENTNSKREQKRTELARGKATGDSFTPSQGCVESRLVNSPEKLRLKIMRSCD